MYCTQCMQPLTDACYPEQCNQFRFNVKFNHSSKFQQKFLNELIQIFNNIFTDSSGNYSQNAQS